MKIWFDTIRLANHSQPSPYGYGGQAPRTEGVNFSRNGFSLIEAMLAVTIIGLVLAPLFLLEGTVFDHVTRVAHKFEQFIVAQHFLYQARRAQPIAARDFSLEGKLQRPPVQLAYRLTPAPERSVFAKYKTVCSEQVTVKGAERTDQFVLANLYYKPQESP